ncbi:MAG: methyltransferase domain-containing protein [Magnetococcales bacterium]|nr:methyltransferase domain-containing protein [Magnetococcales bacterium]
MISSCATNILEVQNNVGDFSLAERQKINWRNGSFDLDAVLLRSIKPKPGMRFLDIACGNGHHTRLFMKKISGEGFAAGIDQSSSLIADAISAAKDNLLNISYQVALADDIPYKDTCFDIVTCNYALYHFPDIHAAIREMLRVLVKGGKLILSGPSSTNNSELYEFHDRLGLTVEGKTGRELFENEVRKFFASSQEILNEEHYQNVVSFQSEQDFANYYQKTRLFTDHINKNNHDTIMQRIDDVVKEGSGQFIGLNKKITLFEVTSE